MNIHIGQSIKERADELRMSSSELARSINTSKQNVAGIYKRTSIDSKLLFDISKVLSFNFFSLYDLSGVMNPKEDARHKELEALKKEFAALHKELEVVRENNLLLKTINELKKSKQKPRQNRR